MRTWPAIDVEHAAPAQGDLVQVLFLDHDLAAVEELSPSASRYFFRTPSARAAAASAVATAFPDLPARPVDIPDEDWVARSQAGLRAVTVGALTVAPPWDAGEPSATTIVIRPAMGFGTGHHATTRLCLRALQALDPRGRSVLDVGTGSGVLAIASSRLGARSVLAIDDDPDALDAARENATLNPGVAVSFAHTDFRALDIAPVDLLLANLTGGLLVAGAAALLRLVGPGGRLILSGFPIEGAGDVRAAFGTADVEHEAHEDEWAAVTLRYTADDSGAHGASL